jgi:hypothetical protein
MTTTEKKIHHAITDWVGDIVALETHVEEAMGRQIKMEFPNPGMMAAIQSFYGAVSNSKQRAEAFQERYGSEPGNPIIKAGTNLLGKAAGMIDLMREDGVAKALRDDYTACNLLAISYTMLHTTAMALEDPATQAFAEQGLRTYASLVQEINHLMPEVVVEELKDNDGHPLQNTNVAAESRCLIQHVWQSTTND